jgi:hypothetical protein
MTEVTRIPSAIGQGDARAAEELLPLVYEELRRLAVHQLAHEKPGHTLDATALVHEAYLRLAAGHGAGAEQPHWDARRHFFAAAAGAAPMILPAACRAAHFSLQQNPPRAHIALQRTAGPAHGPEGVPRRMADGRGGPG